MLKKDELTNPASCLNKAGARERIFVLRENDPLFSQSVRHWATMADGLHEPAKIAEANELAAAAEKARADRDKPVCAPDPRGSGEGTPVAAPPARFPCTHCGTTGHVHAPWCRHVPAAL